MKSGLMSSPVLLLVNKDKKSDKNCLRSLERLTTKNVIAIDVMEGSGSFFVTAHRNKKVLLKSTTNNIS